MTEVYLNVYEFSETNSFSRSLGIGIFHCTVKVGKYEYEWGCDTEDYPGSTGIVVQCTKSTMGVYLYESIQIGETDMKFDDDDGWYKLAVELAKKRGRYNAICNNCNHFAEAFCQLLCGQSIPSWINRTARLAAVSIWG